MTIEKAFGEILKELRESKNMSQEVLAFNSNLDRTYISLLERAKRKPTINTVFALATSLDMQANELIRLVELEYQNKKN